MKAVSLSLTRTILIMILFLAYFSFTYSLLPRRKLKWFNTSIEL